MPLPRRKRSADETAADVAARRQRAPVLAACLMATAMTAIETTILATAAPTIATSLQGVGLYAWLFSAYMLAQALTIPICGQLAKQVGRKRVFIAGSTLFLIGSALCGVATGIIDMIVFRAVQGLGAGAILPVASAIVGDVYNPVERARIKGMLSAVFGAAVIVGPACGVLLLNAGSWRLIFWINVPISAAAIAMIMMFSREDRQGGRHNLDIKGAGLLILGMAAIGFAAGLGPQLGPVQTAALVAFGVASIAAFAHQETCAAEPMLPLQLWRRRQIALVSAGSFAVGAVIMSLIAFIPSFIQGPMGRGADTSGLVLGILMIAWLLGSVAAGQIMIFLPYRLTACAGSLAIIVGAAVLLTLTPSSSVAQIVLGASIAGLGIGSCNASWLALVQAVASHEQRETATAASIFMRFLGQAFGVLAAGAILVVAFHHALAGNPDPLGQLLENTPTRSSTAGRALADAVAACFRDIFILTELLGAATLIVAILLPRPFRAAAPRPIGVRRATLLDDS